MTTTINDSSQLAELFNTHAPATAADATETPRDWIEGLWVAGTLYRLDPAATTDTVAVLADGTAAVKLSPKGEHCGGEHRVSRNYTQEHWCPADVEHWSATDDVRGVDRDWRSVHVWDANGFSETTVHPTLDAAKTAYSNEVEQLSSIN